MIRDSVALAFSAALGTHGLPGLGQPSEHALIHSTLVPCASAPVPSPHRSGSLYRCGGFTSQRPVLGSAVVTLSSSNTVAAYTRAGSSARAACLLDLATGGAYRRPGDRTDITVILQLRLRVRTRRGEQGCREVGGGLTVTRKAALCGIAIGWGGIAIGWAAPPAKAQANDTCA